MLGGLLLKGLVLLLFTPVYEASSLGLTVHVLPQDSEEGKTVGNIKSFHFVFTQI